MIVEAIVLEEKNCGNCGNYLRHYTFSGEKLISVYCGHCMLERVKSKRPHAKACENYVPSETKNELFASKEYLTKKLLEHVLNMELLPEIEEQK